MTRFYSTSDEGGIRERTPSFACSNLDTMIPTVEAAETPLRDSFVGFGAAITGASCFNLRAMEPSERAALLRHLYTEEGIGMSVGRLTMGSSDYSADVYTYNDGDEDVAQRNFSVEKDDEYIVPMIREIVAANPGMMLYAAPWSPPGWMKTGGSISRGYLRDQYVDSHVTYLMKFLTEYEKRGIHVSALTSQNEPEVQAPYATCAVPPDTECRIVMALREKLDSANMDTEIWLLDDNFAHWRRVVWCYDEYPELLRACKNVAFHYYSGAAERISDVRAHQPSLSFHFTEGGPRVWQNFATDWCKWGAMIARALNQNCRTFTGWNLLLDQHGDPCVGPHLCGGLVMRDSVSGEITYSGQYRAYAHFSKFIRPGAKIYPARVLMEEREMGLYPETKEPMVACAAKNPDGTYVLQVVNPGDVRRQAQFLHAGRRWYLNLHPNSLNTLVLEE